MTRSLDQHHVDDFKPGVTQVWTANYNSIGSNLLGTCSNFRIEKNNFPKKIFFTLTLGYHAGIFSDEVCLDLLDLQFNAASPDVPELIYEMPHVSGMRKEIWSQSRKMTYFLQLKNPGIAYLSNLKFQTYH